MIFVDTNVFMYAVGREHPLRTPCREFFEEAIEQKLQLVTSAEVLQELLHAYLPIQRMMTLDSVMGLVERTVHDVWALDFRDVQLARQLVSQYPSLGARDLCHLASCRRHGVTEIKTFDQGLAGVSGLKG